MAAQWSGRHVGEVCPVLARPRAITGHLPLSSFGARYGECGRGAPEPPEVELGPGAVRRRGPSRPAGGGYRCQAGVGGRLVPPLWAELQLCLCECEADWPKGGFA